MRGTNLYKTLNALNSKKINRFEKFLHSPYFNQRNDLISLFDYYRKEANRSNSKFLKEEVHAYLFPDSVFNDQELRLLYSRLYNQLKNFLYIEQAQKQNSKTSASLALAFLDLGHANIFFKTLDNAKKELKLKPWRNADYYRKMFEIESHEFDYYALESRSSENNLQYLSKTFDFYYYANKLMQACLILGHQAVYKKDYNFSTINTVIEYLETRPDIIKLHPAISIYYYFYLAMKNPEKEHHFLKFKDLLYKHRSLFKHSELRLTYVLAINYCAKKINSGESRYIREVFNFYKSGIENKYLLSKNVLTQFTFKNAVTSALKLKEFDWVEQFIVDYKNNLPAQQRESIYTFSLAKIKQVQGNYKEAMALLIHFSSDDYLLTLAAKTLLLKMYFELNEHDSLSSLLQSMNVYLNRKKVLSYHKKHYKNVIKFSNKLLNLAPYDNKAKSKLKIEIETAEMISEKDWFLEQLAT